MGRLRYVIDLGMDDQPVWLTTRNRLLCVPYALELNDSTTIVGRRRRDGLRPMIIDQLTDA